MTLSSSVAPVMAAHVYYLALPPVTAVRHLQPSSFGLVHPTLSWRWGDSKAEEHRAIRQAQESVSTTAAVRGGDPDRWAAHGPVQGQAEPSCRLAPGVGGPWRMAHPRVRWTICPKIAPAGCWPRAR